MNEHDRVVLTVPLPEQGLKPEDVGTVVHIYADGEAIEVEFVALDGHTKGPCGPDGKAIHLRQTGLRELRPMAASCQRQRPSFFEEARQ